MKMDKGDRLRKIIGIATIVVFTLVCVLPASGYGAIKLDFALCLGGPADRLGVERTREAVYNHIQASLPPGTDRTEVHRWLEAYFGRVTRSGYDTRYGAVEYMHAGRCLFDYHNINLTARYTPEGNLIEIGVSNGLNIDDQ